MNKILYDAFYDPEEGMQSSTKLYQKLKNKGITLKQVIQFIENQEAHQLNRQPVRVKHYFPITSMYENEIMQIDLADMSDIATTNDNYKWLLCGIDAFTRKAYVIPLKNKTAVSVTTGMKHILDSAVPHIVNCDNGSEFTSNEFKNLMQTNNIDVRYAPVGDHHKLGIIDRFI